MKFNATSATGNTVLNQANKNLIRVFTELALRDDNCYSGSKHGGNSFQLFALMEMKHELVPSTIPITIKDNVVMWGMSFLLNDSISNHRKHLDKAFDQINDRYKTTSMFINGLLEDNNLISNYQKYKANFPLVEKCFNNMKIDPNISVVEQFLLACLICNHVSEVLDSSVSNTGFGWAKNANTKQLMIDAANILLEFDPAIHLISVRRFITFSRLMNYDFTMLPEWKNNFERINNILKQN